MTLFLADTSAWNRSNSTDEIRERWLELQDRGELAVCAPVSLELLYSARGPKDYTAMKDELAGFPYLRLNELALSAARRAQDGLARRSQHRGPVPADLLVAGIAEANGATLLHYDRHFEAIARVTGQPAEWLASPGSIP